MSKPTCDHKGELDAFLDGAEVVFLCACGHEVKRMHYVLDANGRPTIKLKADTSNWRMITGTSK